MEVTYDDFLRFGNKLVKRLIELGEIPDNSFFGSLFLKDNTLTLECYRINGDNVLYGGFYKELLPLMNFEPIHEVFKLSKLRGNIIYFNLSADIYSLLQDKYGVE